jgi:hypothetical protein
MADQNLLNDDDFFAKSKSDKEEPKDKKEDVYSEEENLFKNKNIDEQSAKELADIESSLQERSDIDFKTGDQPKDFADVLQGNFEKETVNPPVKDDIKETPAQKPKAQQEDISYKQVYFDMDDQQDKVSYKPFFISMLVVIILGVGGYFLYDLYLKDMFFSSGPATTQQTQQIENTTPVSDKSNDNGTGAINNNQAAAQPGSQKTTYLSRINGETNQEIKSIANVINVSRQSTKLSSILLYDSDFTFEVFGTSREDLAKLNIALKKSNNIQDLKIVSSRQRPGTNGGVFGVYTAKLNNTASAGNRIKMNLPSADKAGAWLRDILLNNKLKVKDYKDRATENKEMFKVHEIEATASGSISACMNALNAIANAGTNIKLYKLSCSAVDQQNFGTSNYQLKIVLKVYV